MLDRVPTEEDWDNWDDDKPYDCVVAWNRPDARNHFFGVLFDDACLMFKQDFMIYMDDLGDMPRVCFHYYFFALCDFLMRHLNNHDCENHDKFEYSISDAASCFFYIIEHRIHYSKRSIIQIKDKIIPYIDKISQNQSCFDAKVEIYGSFLDRAEKLKIELSKL